MGRKIVVGKIGQKLIFNRNGRECNRSNTNGNVGAYLFFKLLFEKNKDDIFYVVGENDLSTFKHGYKNVIDASKYSNIEKIGIRPDFGVFIIGMTNTTNTGEKSIAYINESGVKWLLVADDPRCLNAKAVDIRNLPSRIISQFRGSVLFCGKRYFVDYVPIETASCYGYEYIQETIKEKDLVVVANTAGRYNRLEIVDQLTKGIDGVEIFGRLDHPKYLEDSRFKGEVKFELVQRYMSEAKTTLLVPIMPGWVTSKYIEALMNGVVPIFYKDYGVKLLPFMYDELVVENRDQTANIKNFFCSNADYSAKVVESLRAHYIYPFSSGCKLNEMLNNVFITM